MSKPTPGETTVVVVRRPADRVCACVYMRVRVSFCLLEFIFFYISIIR